MRVRNLVDFQFVHLHKAIDVLLVRAEDSLATTQKFHVPGPDNTLSFWTMWISSAFPGV